MISNFISAQYKILHLSVQWPLHNGNTAFPGLLCLSGISDNPIIINFYIDKSKCPQTLVLTVGEIPQQTTEKSTLWCLPETPIHQRIGKQQRGLQRSV